MPILPRWAPGPLFVVLALLLGGYDGLHSDLAIQRALVAIRLWPHGWPDDLVMDHAGAHPGLLPDLLALAVQALGPAALPGLELALYLGVLGLSGALLGALARALSRPVLPLLLLCALPVALLGEGRLLHPALIARTLALPLWLGALLYLVRGEGPRAGLLAGLTLAVHPASGLGPALGVLALAPRALPARALGAAPLLPWAMLGAEPAAPLELLRLRLGHHLDPRDWAAVGWLTLGASVLAWQRGGGPAASPRLSRFFHLQLLFIALCAGGALSGVAPLARLHGAYAANSLWVLGALSVSRWPRLALSGGLLLSLLGPLPGGDGAFRLSPPLSPPVDQRPTPRLEADPWRRVREGEPLWLTLKDGGEIAGGAPFAARWSARLVAVCGPQVLDPVRPGAERQGWRRVAARCPATLRRP
jgi:hypothetical protein